MRQPHGLRYALLGVVSHSPSGIHGYALRRKCEAVLGGFWQVNFGEVYRILDRLVGENLIEQVASERTSARKLFRITDKGRQSLDTFILEPPSDTPRPLRHDLAVKLLFADADHLPHLLELIRYQREAYLRALQRVDVQRRRVQRLRGDTFVTGLLIDGAELSVRAEITWLDEVAQKLRARYRPHGE
jgi:DNA-binding PadR family transcriptional regulator